MNVTDINQVRAARAKCHTDVADLIDLAVAVGLLCSATQIRLAAQYLLDTGRIEQARKLTKAAALAHDFYRGTLPFSLKTDPANERVDRPGKELPSE